MYDTIVLKSPYIYSQKLIERLFQYMRMTRGVNLYNGEILYEFTNGELQGSYDYRIRLNLKDYEWKNELGIPEKIKTDYYIEVECSVHKLMMNHNCYGGPNKIIESIKYIIMFLENCIDNSMPVWYEWEVKRIDIAYIYRFENDEEIRQYLFKLKNIYYSRRGIGWPTTGTGFYINGSTTTVKGYMKYPEFIRNDYKRIKKYCLKMRDIEIGSSREIVYNKVLEEIENIKENVKGIFRIEVEIHKRKIEEIFACNVKNLNDEMLNEIFEKELGKIFWDIGDEENMVNKSYDVVNRLNLVYGETLGRTLYGTWSMLATFGKKEVREKLSKSTYYRHLKLIAEAGCIWDITDLSNNNNSNVIIFRPCIKNADNKVDNKVEEKLRMVI